MPSFVDRNVVARKANVSPIIISLLSTDYAYCPTYWSGLPIIANVPVT